MSFKNLCRHEVMALIYGIYKYIYIYIEREREREKKRTQNISRIGKRENIPEVQVTVGKKNFANQQLCYNVYRYNI